MAQAVDVDGDYGRVEFARNMIQEGRRSPEDTDGWINNNYPKILDYHPSSMTPVELQVTNLDQNIDQRDMKKTIMNIFREHVSVMSVSVFFQSDGNMAACVRVPSHQDAQYAISQLHRKKIGFKRILISHSHGQTHNPLVLRSKVVALLSEVPHGKLQLFKFREMYEKRYHDSIGVSDLYKMKDVVTISEEHCGRMVQLNYQWWPQTMYSSENSSSARSSGPPVNELFMGTTQCPIHNAQEKNKENKGWAERETGAPLPSVHIGLTVLGDNVKLLIRNHGGSIPLATLTSCYEAENGPLNVNNDDGVPLEHLVTAIRGIEIHTGPTSGIKMLTTTSSVDMIGGASDTSIKDTGLVGQLRSGLSQYSGSTSSINSLGPLPAAPLANQLALFSRELVDLLKWQPGCRVPFHKFIPNYHHYFGRQCRVADYGYTKLKDLFEALPHVVQIIGEGSRAMITLSHRAQVKRFTSDLLKVLKTQPAKRMALHDLPGLFSKCLLKQFKINDYGVCEVEDILNEVSETSVVLSSETIDGTDDLIISIPKREQTSDEVERTHKFAEECVELLKHVPECRLAFNKFIPAYHHHFGRQCRVADYGFTKLIELFETIPTTIEITEDADGERILQLTDAERLVVVGEQIADLIRNTFLGKRVNTYNGQSIPLFELEHLYRRQYGYALRPEDFGQSSLKGVIEKMGQILRLDNADAEDEEQIQVRLIDRMAIRALSIQVKAILAEDSNGKMLLDIFKEKFDEKYPERGGITESELKTDLSDLLEIETEENKLGEKEEIIQLKPLQLCAVRIQSLLRDYKDKISMADFEAAFAEKFSTPLCPGQYGFPGLANLISALSDNFVVRGRGPKKMICIAQPGKIFNNSKDMYQVQRGVYPVSSYSKDYFSRSGMMDRGASGIPTRLSTPRYDAFRMVQPPNVHESFMGREGYALTGPRAYRSGGPPNPASWSMTMPPRRHRPISQQNSQLRFNQPPPPPPSTPNSQAYGSSSSHELGFGGSSGPGCGGGDFWAELAQFGIYPSNSSSGSANARSIFSSSISGLLSTSPACGSPTSSPGLLDGKTTSMLPTPHSPSPLLQGNKGSTHFAFPPTNFWPSGSAEKSGFVAPPSSPAKSSGNLEAAIYRNRNRI